MSSSEQAQRASADHRLAHLTGAETDAYPAPDSRSYDGSFGQTRSAAAILRERAALYARANSNVAAAPRTEMLLFRVRNEEYAADLRYLRGVVRVDGLSPVPCTPASVAGVLNVRGQIVSVLDLAVVLGLAGSHEIQAGSQIVLVDVAEMLVGLLVDEVRGAHDMALDSLDQSLTGRDSVLGVAEGRIVVLDLQQLLSDDRFAVGEPVRAGV